MKKLALLFLFICFLTCGCGKKQMLEDDLTKITRRGKLIVGVRTDARPFGFRDKDGNIIGYDIDIARKISRYVLGNENIQFVPVTASNRILKLNAGECDILVAAMSVTEQRQYILDFSTPYYTAGQAILVNSGSKIRTLQDLQHKKVIIVFGSTSERNVRTTVPNVIMVGYKTYPEAYRALKSGKASAMIADDTILMNFAISDPSVKILPKRYSREPYAVAFRKEDETLRLQNEVNTVIENLQSTGELRKMQTKWNIKQ